jgi:tRNA pseudouridine55 synthase
MEHLRITEQDLRQGKILVIDKPLGWTSFDVVNKIRSVLRKRFNLKKIKVGHGGTLDPLATGVLVIGIGKATKRLQDLQNSDKEYTGVMRLGLTTPSYDAETSPDAVFSTEHITPGLLRETAELFTGDLEQYPPPYSAVKKQGKKLYEWAREGKKVEIKPRRVHIYKFVIDNIQLPDVYFTAHVSKGTYIRSLVHDFGKKIESGAFLLALRRTRSGNFDLSAAVNLEEWVKANKKFV